MTYLLDLRQSSAGCGSGRRWPQRSPAQTISCAESRVRRHFSPLLLLFLLVSTGLAVQAQSCAQDPAYSSLSVKRISPGKFELSINLSRPNVYQIERSRNLLKWETALTQVVTGEDSSVAQVTFEGDGGFVRVTQRDDPHVPGRLLLRFAPGTNLEQQQQALDTVLAKRIGEILTPAMSGNDTPPIVIAATDLSAPAASRLLAENPLVRMVEPDWIYTGQGIPDDPQFTIVPSISYWNLGCSTCQGSLSSGQGSQAAEAWNRGYVGSGSVSVGIVDSGVAFMHPDLTNNMWVNPAERFGAPANDDDGNGYLDDERGWNYFLGSYACNTPTGGNGVVFAGGAGSNVDTHGTHIAGIIGAQGSNHVGQAGLCWNVTMVPVKFLGPQGGSSTCAAMAIDYLTHLKSRGSNIVAINASWGGTQYSWQLHEAILRAAKANILVVAAAGNCGQDIDRVPFYPACYDTTQLAVGNLGASGPESRASYDAVISVAAIDQSGFLATFGNGQSSSYGPTNVDLGAPGKNIYSTISDQNCPQCYGSKSGTSMAAAHVTGALALYAAAYPNSTAPQRRARLLDSTSLGLPGSGSLRGTTVTGGRLNAAEMLRQPLVPGCSLPDCFLFVDRGYIGTLENGCLSTPYKTVTQAYSVAQNGCVLKIATGTYSIGTTPLPGKGVLFEPRGGNVLLQSR
jgi:subtilisin family serine protease